MLYITVTEISKATAKPRFSCLLWHPTRKQSGSVLGHTQMLTYLVLIWHSPLSTNDSSAEDWRTLFFLRWA